MRGIERAVRLWLVPGVVIAAGCGSRPPLLDTEAETCDPRVVADGLCPGAPAVVCADTCAVAGDCTATVDVTPTSVDLVGRAPSGACIRLAPGTYPALAVADVSLYGAGESRVRVDGLEVTATRRVRVRGVRIDGGGLRTTGGGEVRLEGVRVTAAAAPSIRAMGPISLDRVTIEGGRGAGVDACEGHAAVSLAHVVVRRPRGVGVATCGAELTLRGVWIDGTAPQDFTFGRAVEIHGGAVRATATLLAGGAEAGLYVLDATAWLGPEFHVEGHKPGLVAGRGSNVLLDGFTLTQCGAAGVLLSSSARATLRNGAIGPVIEASVPTTKGGAASIGDALEAAGAAHLDVEASVSLRGAPRRLAVLDALCTGTFAPRLPDATAAHRVVVQGDEASALALGAGVDVEHLPRTSALPILVSP